MIKVEVHPVTPEKRFITKIANVFSSDGILIYPTDSGYSLGCSALSKKAIKHLYKLKKPAKKYNMALMFQHFSPISEFAQLDNFAFKYMKPLVPGPYTFILPPTNWGRKMLEVKRLEMGIRFPDHPLLSALYTEFPDPILTTSAHLNPDDVFVEPDEIERIYSSNVDMIVDCGPIPQKPTTVISLINGTPELIRQGTGTFQK
ncbi:MAG: threonylcarbamoyl-AMP synthase [Fibrobacteria bacterium]|nr:threonylcarbamoyl-AMP synthase [Fibrobacteria bacterium]